MNQHKNQCKLEWKSVNSTDVTWGFIPFNCNSDSYYIHAVAVITKLLYFRIFFYLALV